MRYILCKKNKSFVIIDKKKEICGVDAKGNLLILKGRRYKNMGQILLRSNNLEEIKAKRNDLKKKR